MLIYSCFFLVLVGSVVHSIINKLVLHELVVILITWCTNLYNRLYLTWQRGWCDSTIFTLTLRLFNPYNVFVPCNVFNPYDVFVPYNVFNPFSVSVRGGGGGGEDNLCSLAV